MVVTKLIRDNAPYILSGMAIYGVIETGVQAVKATPKAVEALDIYYMEMDKTPSVKEAVQLTWRFYIPTIVTAVGTIACIVGLNYLHFRREASLIAAYSFAESKFKEYRNAVGEKKDEKLRADISEKKRNAHRIDFENCTDGKMWCYEPESDQYFQTTTEQILWAELTANKMFKRLGELSFNDFLELLPGCKKVPWGDHFGWYTYDEDGSWDYNWSYYPGGTPWIDIQPQLVELDDGKTILQIAYGMHPGDDLDCKDLEQPEQYELKS